MKNVSSWQYLSKTKTKSDMNQLVYYLFDIKFKTKCKEPDITDSFTLHFAHAQLSLPGKVLCASNNNDIFHTHTHTHLYLYLYLPIA